MASDCPAWPAASRPVFNLAIDGAGPRTQYDYLQHALATTSPKLVLVGVSFEDAMTYPPGPARRLSADTAAQWSYEARLRTRPDGAPNPDHGLARLKDLAFATVSLKAVRDSVLTMLDQGNRFSTYQTAHGQNDGGKFLKWTLAEGQYSLFMDKDRQKAREFVSWRRQHMTEVAPVGELIRLAQRHGARVIIYIIPSHAEELEVWRQLGMTRFYQAWRAELAGVVEAAGAAGSPVPLWDFSGFSQFTTETVPAPGDVKTVLQWIWEPIHFRPQLGTLMVQRMVDGTGPADLGAQISVAGLPDRAVAYDEAQAAWVTGHPADVARIAGVVDAAVRDACRAAPDACMAAGRETAAR